jgi:hypothetical protein
MEKNTQINKYTEFLNSNLKSFLLAKSFNLVANPNPFGLQLNRVFLCDQGICHQEGLKSRLITSKDAIRLISNYTTEKCIMEENNASAVLEKETLINYINSL